MKYNVYDGIDMDDYSYQQEVGLATSAEDISRSMAYYELLETTDNILDLIV